MTRRQATMTTTKQSLQCYKNQQWSPISPFFFGQFPLKTDVQPFYGFMVDGEAGPEYYVPTSAPTGGRHLPTAAQILTWSTAQKCGRDATTRIAAPWPVVGAAIITYKAMAFCTHEWWARRRYPLFAKSSGVAERKGRNVTRCTRGSSQVQAKCKSALNRLHGNCSRSRRPRVLSLGAMRRSCGRVAMLAVRAAPSAQRAWPL
jgi:hypothetical protein